MYSYLILDLILLILWCIVWLAIPRESILRRQMLWSSIALLPVGLTDHWFIPEYWNPNTIFNIYRVSLESFLFCFAVGGLAAVLYELAFHYRIRKTTKKARIIHWLWLILIILSGLVTTNLMEINFMYDALIAMSVGVLYLVVIRFDLVKELFAGGVVFAVLYILVYALVIKFDPYFVYQWSLENLSGRYILGIPIEEIYWAFLFGATWAVLFEDIKDYKTISAPEPELDNVAKAKLV